MAYPSLQDMNEPPRSRAPWAVAAVVFALAALAVVLTVRARRGAARGESVESDPAPAPAPVAAAPSGALALAMQEAAEMEKAGLPADARERLLRVLDQFPGAPGTETVESKVGELGILLVMSPHLMPEKKDYIVAAGDSLERIARQFGTTPELAATNNLIANPNLIKRGDKLRMLAGVFRVHVNKTRNDLVLTLNDRFFKRYRVGTGKFGKTPVGSFVVTDRIPNPAWWRPDGRAVPFGDPENILGTRWLAIKPTGDTPPVSGYGIHGTWDEESIGKAESAGCVRMRNRDVEELFLLLPLGTEVVIEE